MSRKKKLQEHRRKKRKEKFELFGNNLKRSEIRSEMRLKRDLYKEHIIYQ
jgi:hypothetical protein